MTACQQFTITLGTTALIVLFFALVVTLHPGVSNDTTASNPVSAASSTGMAAPTGMVNTTAYQQACNASCGTGRCTQSTLTGIVLSCAGTSSASTTCATTPWCSTNETTSRVLPVHNALIQAALDYVKGNASLVQPVYPGTAITMAASSNYSRVLSPVLGSTAAVDSVRLLNLFLDALFQLRTGRVPPSSAVPTPWFDDQSGWWHTNWNAFETAIEPEYITYVTELKKRLCKRTWQADCSPPALL